MHMRSDVIALFHRCGLILAFVGWRDYAYLAVLLGDVCEIIARR